MEQLKAKIDTVGMEEFTRIFLAAHDDKKYILNPEELVVNQPKEVMNEFLEIYHRELKEFHARMIRAAMPSFTSEGIATMFMILDVKDLPKERIEQVLDEAIAAKQ